jgi:hypothetical protein
VSLRCLLGQHDWENLNSGAERVCLRCRRHQVSVDTGGGWGGWDDITAVKAAATERDRRQRKAKLIARHTDGTTTEVQR